MGKLTFREIESLKQRLLVFAQYDLDEVMHF